jgi:hypothetical protein
MTVHAENEVEAFGLREIYCLMNLISADRLVLFQVIENYSSNGVAAISPNAE